MPPPEKTAVFRMPGLLSRLAGLLFCAALLACAPDTRLADLRASEPTAGLARIVLLYPAPVTGDNGTVQVRYDKRAACDLPSGSYSVREVEPGTEKLDFSFCGMQAVTSLTLETEAGGKYYLRVLPYDSSLRGMLSGYPGEVPPHSRIRTRTPLPGHGPFQVEILDEHTAFVLLEALSPASR